MSQYNLGLKALKRYVEDGNPYPYFRAKLGEQLFKGELEKQLFEVVNTHFTKYMALPKAETLVKLFPEFAEVQAPEPASYYLDMLETRFSYDLVNKANLKSQEILKADQKNVGSAIQELEYALGQIKLQQYRTRILDFGQEGKDLVYGQYKGTMTSDMPLAAFGWPYMDNAGLCMPGDVISLVGRPAMGKTWFLLYIALHNWMNRHMNVLFVSMEMNTLAIAQRLAAMYAGTNISQLKIAGYASSTLKTFMTKMVELVNQPGKLYVMDGNLAAAVDDIYITAKQLGCHAVCIDGAYLLRNKNTRLDRFTRVADNVELMKRWTTDTETTTFASWQFNRDASKKKKDEKPGLEDIGYSDAIGQVSSIVLALLQEEGVETIMTRLVDVIKGRNGEVGKFEVNWLFNVMNFDQVGVEQPKDVQLELEYV